VTRSAYRRPTANEHPIGTGPPQVSTASDRANNTITLLRKRRLLGRQGPRWPRLIFKIIPDENARQAGSCGARHDRRATTSRPRPTWASPAQRRFPGADPQGRSTSSNLGINQKNNPALEGPAGAPGAGLRHQPPRRWCRTRWPEGAVVPAQRDCRRRVAGYAPGRGRPTRTTRPGPRRCSPRPGATNLTLNFYYPTEGHPALHAEPERTSSRWSPRTWRQIGITVNPVPEGRGTAGYKDDVAEAGQAGTCTCSAGPGDYNDAGNFLGTFLSAGPKPEFGFDTPALLFNELSAADATSGPRPPGARGRPTSRPTRGEHHGQVPAQPFPLSSAPAFPSWSARTCHGLRAPAR